MQVRCRDFKPMLTSRPGLHDLVKARALQSLTEQIQRFPSMWRGRGLKVGEAGACSAAYATLRRPGLVRLMAGWQFVWSRWTCAPGRLAGRLQAGPSCCRRTCWPPTREPAPLPPARPFAHAAL